MMNDNYDNLDSSPAPVADPYTTVLLCAVSMHKSLRNNFILSLKSSLIKNKTRINLKKE